MTEREKGRPGRKREDRTARDREIVSHLSRGLSDAQVGVRIGFSRSLVAKEIYRMLKERGLSSRAELVRWYALADKLGR